MAKTRVLHVRITPELAEQVQKAADADLRSVSSWVANLLEKTLNGRKKSEPRS